MPIAVTRWGKTDLCRKAGSFIGVGGRSGDVPFKPSIIIGYARIYRLRHWKLTYCHVNVHYWSFRTLGVADSVAFVLVC